MNVQMKEMLTCPIKLIFLMDLKLKALYVADL